MRKIGSAGKEMLRRQVIDDDGEFGDRDFLVDHLHAEMLRARKGGELEIAAILQEQITDFSNQKELRVEISHTRRWNIAFCGYIRAIRITPP